MVDTSIFKKIEPYWHRAPVDVEAIVEACGIEYNEAYLRDGVSGMIEPAGNGSFRITVESRDARVRRRFTAAHELGHYIYHRDLIGDGLDDDRLYRSTEVGKYHNTRVGQKQETEANRFAANLLMPNHLIRRIRQEGNSSPEDLAKALQVSRQAMRIRLGLPAQDDMFETQGHEDEEVQEISEPTFAKSS